MCKVALSKSCAKVVIIFETANTFAKKSSGKVSPRTLLQVFLCFIDFC